MIRTSTALTASLLAAAALVPATAGAAHLDLGGQPTLRQVDATHAQLRFAADRLPRRANGAVDARVSIAGQRVGTIRPTGRHGGDVVYGARVTAPAGLRAGAKYTVRIRLAGGRAIVRLVKLRPAG
jgi:hypothetical protein